MITKMHKTDTILTVYFYISVCSSNVIESPRRNHERKENEYIKGKYIKFY